MGTERKKCPLCNKKMVPVNGIPTCPDCGYRDPRGTGYSQGTSQGTGTAQGTGYSQGTGNYQGSGASAGAQRTGGENKPAGQKGTGEKKAGGKAKSAAVAVWSVLGSVLAIIAAGVIFSFTRWGVSGALDNLSDTLKRWTDKSSESRQTPASTEVDPMEIIGSKENAEESGSRPDIPQISVKRPQSAFLAALTEEIFQKPLGQLTAEELSSIIYLDIHNVDETDVVETRVMLEDNTELYYLFSGYDIDTADFDCLTGLQYLFLETGSVSFDTDWHALKQLHTLSCDISLKELAGKMDVSQLYWLRSEETFGMSDLSVLSSYTSLEYLELEAGLLSSIAGISGAPSLRELYIEDGDRISDYSELYNMTGLEALSIESSGLKDIGFIEGMDQLYLLELKGTEIRNIDAVSSCADTLTALYLDENYQVTDISPVMDCTNLEALQLWVRYDFDVPMEVPDFSAMTSLRSLDIEGYDKFTNLPLLTGLEYLAIECPGSADGEPLRQMANLKTLWLRDMSVFEELLDCVASLDSLEVLNLEDSFIWCDISPVFNMPNLQGLSLKDAEFGLCPEKVTGEGSLVSLDLTDARVDALLEDGSWNYGEKAAISVQEMLDTLAPFMPGLGWLYVPGQELDSLDFAASLEQLIWLDISNNYVTDLTPLTGLQELTVLLCEDNPIRSKDGLDHVLIYD